MATVSEIAICTTLGRCLNMWIRGGKATSYWFNTSANEVIMEACQQLEVGDQKILGDLLNGEPVATKLNMALTYGETWSDKEIVCGLLVLSGYLKAEPYPELDDWYLVRIPNREVGEVYAREIIKRTREQLKHDY